jgi:hypothetical protein
MIRALLIALLALTVFAPEAAAIYDPATGRFITRDPAGYVDGMNLYRYGRSNPARYTDPMGLSSNPIHRWVIKQFDNQWDVKDFVYHYYGPGGMRYDPTSLLPVDVRFGTGDTVDLGEVGRGNWYKNKAAVKKRIQKCRDLAKKLKEQMDAGGDCEPDHSRMDDHTEGIPGDEFEDAGVGFVIGGHKFSCNVRCTKQSGKTKCSIDYGMYDRFKDPADTLNLINGPGTDIEPGGTPYDIVYDWSEDYP